MSGIAAAPLLLLEEASALSAATEGVEASIHASHAGSCTVFALVLALALASFAPGLEGRTQCSSSAMGAGLGTLGEGASRTCKVLGVAGALRGEEEEEAAARCMNLRPCTRPERDVTCDERDEAMLACAA